MAEASVDVPVTHTPQTSNNYDYTPCKLIVSQGAAQFSKMNLLGNQAIKFFDSEEDTQIPSLEPCRAFERLFEIGASRSSRAPNPASMLSSHYLQWVY